MNGQKLITVKLCYGHIETAGFYFNILGEEKSKIQPTNEIYFISVIKMANKFMLLIISHVQHMTLA
jgi:hypothetical protein